MSTTQVALYVPGLAFTIGGTILWAWNDFGAWIAEGTGKKVSASWRAVTRVLARLGLRRSHVYADAVTGTATFSGSAEAYVSVGDDASLDEKVAFLMRQDREHQLAFQRLEQRLTDDLGAAVKDLRASFQTELTDRIHRLETKNINRRRAGVALVVLGAVLLAIYPFA
jgi:hypothetical protein